MKDKTTKKKKIWSAPVLNLLTVNYTAGGRLYDSVESNGYAGPHGNHSS